MGGRGRRFQTSLRIAPTRPATYEFRIGEDDAANYLGPTVGKALGSVRRVEVRPDDPLFAKIGELQRQSKRDRGHGIFYSWTVRRRYDEEQLEAAEALRLVVPTVFEPAGEQCGTVYDDSDACQFCGVGRTQVSELRLDLRKLQRRDIETRTHPSRKDVAKTIADEIVVSERFAVLFESRSLTGATFPPIGRCEQPEQRWDGWRQLKITSKPVNVADPTTFGVDPFDEGEEGRFRCPQGHVAGLNVLSEVSIRRADWEDSDIAPTVQHYGRRAGLLVPAPILIISQRLYGLIKAERITGVKVEPAYIR